MAHWLLEEQTRNASQQAQSQRAASELEMERRNILNAMRYREPEKGLIIMISQLRNLTESKRFD